MNQLDLSGDHRSKTKARTHFEQWSRYYDRSWLNELVFFPSIRRCQEEILRWQNARGQRPFRILDVGCGTATLLAILSRDPLAERLVGLDYSPAMIAQAAQKKLSNPDLAERLSLTVGDAERLPFASASFDVVTCCNSFHHYPHQSVAVGEFRRVLRPGGILVLIDGFRDNVVGWVVFDVAVTLVERDVHHAAWSAVRQMAADAGFSIARQEKMNVLAPLLVTVANA
ncbi:MAG: class I SAM-dependent methyltransferase [Phycisphaerales bacterium]|nr:class I SAM-dependent methyltransferase [Phycisphaerales bacterium]